MNQTMLNKKAIENVMYSVDGLKMGRIINFRSRRC